MRQIYAVARRARTDAYFHVKYVPEGRGKGSSQAGDQTGANVGQNIFYRPASSGQYTVVVNVDLFRLGRNDITLETVDLGADERSRRTDALVSSVISTFIKPTGAHRNTQNPHIVAFEGCVAFSYGSLPAPTVSALNAKYDEEIDAVKSALDRIHPDSIDVRRFKTIGEFAAVMADLVAAGAR